MPSAYRRTASAGAVLLGAYLPWAQVNPFLPPGTAVPAIYFTGMDAGIAAYDWALVALAALGVVAGYTSARLDAALTTLAGVGVVGCCLLYLRSPLGGFLGTFVPALGWALSLLGGAGFVALGAPESRRRAGEESSREPGERTSRSGGDRRAD